MKKKDKLDEIFSKFIRLRDSFDGTFGACITCGRIKQIKYMDCGHYQKRQHLATRWDEKNCALQCKRCNAFEQGRDSVFAQRIDERYGKGTAEMLRIKSHNMCRMRDFEYDLLIRVYTDKYEKLLKEKR